MIDRFALRQRMRELGVSQAAVCRFAGLRPQHVSRFLRSSPGPTEQMAQRISEAIDAIEAERRAALPPELAPLRPRKTDKNYRRPRKSAGI